jgi:hypothetical protein
MAFVLTRFVFCLSLLAMPALARAQSEPRAIEVPAANGWRHAETGMALPPRVGGLVRVRIGDNGRDEQDVFATYVDRDERMIALVYIYRTGAGDVPLWFDRTLATIMLPQAGASAPAIAGFTRPGASAASGLRAAMSDNVANMRSTAVAIAPLGRSWLVKIRMGSAQLEPAALNERLSAFIAALRWPAETGAARLAVPIEPCPIPLQLREARIVRTETSDVLMDSIVGSIEPEPGQPAGPPPVYCREPGATAERGVYRPDRSTDSYLIALHDAGLAIGVGDASGLSRLLGENRRRFSVTLYDRNATSAYPSFDRLPPPDQAFALVSEGWPLSTSTGNTTTITTTGDPERR